MRAQPGLTSILALCTSVGGAAYGGTGCTPPELVKLLAADAAEHDNFGNAVAVSGNTAVVGSIFDNHAGGVDAGSAYIYVRSGPPGGEVWTQQAKLIASDAAADDWFGFSVAISGDTVLVGAESDVGTISSAGSAYVFVRTGPPGSEVWTQQAKLTASDALAGNQFGYSVALWGDTAVVGAKDGEVSATNSGSAYVFVRTGGVWAFQAELTASDAATNDQFGWSVALSGNTAVVGAQSDDHAGGIDAGSAYVFVRSGIAWTQQAKLIASDTAQSDNFGGSVAVSGDTAVVGAPQDDHTAWTNAGSAWVFVRSGTVWTQQTKLIASDAAHTANFGQSVALSGDMALVGAPRDDHGRPELENPGAAYVFIRSGSAGSETWTQQATLTASDAADEDEFGHSVAVSDDTAMVGSVVDDHAGGEDAGSAYIFDLAGCKSQPCVGDLDDGGAVSGIDLAVLLGQWSGAVTYAPCPPYRTADLNEDCKVNGMDLAMLLAAWGPCP